MKSYLREFQSFSLPARRYLIMHMLGSGLMIGYTVYPVYLKELGITILGVGALYTIADAFKVGLTYFAGRWLDIKGAKAGILLDWSISSLALMVYSVGSRFWHFVVGEMIEKISALFNPGFHAYENAAYEECKREKIYAYHMATPYLVQMLTFPFYALMLGKWYPTTFTYRLTYIGCAVGILGVALYSAKRLPNLKADISKEGKTVWRQIPKELTWVVAIDLLVRFCISLGSNFVFVFLVIDRFHGTVFEIVILQVLFGVATVLASALTKDLSARFSNIAIARFGMLFVMVVPIFVLISTNMVFLYIAYFIVAIGWAIWHPQHQSMKMRLVPEGWRGEFHASLQALKDLMNIPLPLLSGYLAHRISLKAPFVVELVGWILVLALYQIMRQRMKNLPE